MGERKEMMVSIISAVGIVVGIIGLQIITPTISNLITGGVNISSNAANHATGALGVPATGGDVFATARTVVGFIPTFVALGILMAAIGGLVGPGVKITKVARGGDLNIKEAIVGIVSVVVGVIGISIFSPMISTAIESGGALTPEAMTCVTTHVTSAGDLANLCTYATAKTIVTFIPVFFAITLLVGAISTISVAGKVGYDYARGN